MPNFIHRLMTYHNIRELFSSIQPRPQIKDDCDVRRGMFLSNNAYPQIRTKVPDSTA